MYRVELQNFEGPLDLLLYFIKRDELDIYDIPISHITGQYLEYIHFLEELDLEVASEFILMAGTLISIKARMLLPREDSEDDELDEGDPRYELVQALLEYKRFKEMGEELHEFDHMASRRYYRGNADVDKVGSPDGTEMLRDVTLFDLMAAVKHVLKRAREEEPTHSVERVPITVEQQSSFVLETLRKRGRTAFTEICSGMADTIFVVVTFLAVLEMVKESQVVLLVTDNHFDFSLELHTVTESEITSA